MKDIFELRRFGLYARKEFRENCIAYALGLVGMMSIVTYYVYYEWTFVHSGSYYTNYKLDTSISLLLMMALAVWVNASYSFRSFTNKRQTLAALTLPISLTERFLYAWVITLPLSVGIGYTVWKIVWAIALPQFMNDVPNLQTIGTPYWTTNPYTVVMFLGGAGVFMLGAVTLGRLNFLKTLAILIGIGYLVFSWGQEKLLSVIFPTVYKVKPFAPVPWLPPRITIQSTKDNFFNDIHSSFEDVYQLWWLLCVPVLLYAITLLKIKEKQV